MAFGSPLSLTFTPTKTDSFGSPLGILYSPLQVDNYGSPVTVSGILGLAAAPPPPAGPSPGPGGLGSSTDILIRKGGSIYIVPLNDVGYPTLDI